MKRNDQGIARIRRLAKQAERRLRLKRALRVVSVALSAALIVAIVDLALRKVGAIGELTARAFLVAVSVPVVVSGIAAWVWKLPNLAGARVLDRFYGFHDRLANALSFAERPSFAQTPFMLAAMEDAFKVASEAKPSRAIPLGVPRELAVAAVLAGTLGVVSLFEVRHHQLTAQAKTIDSIEMTPDDLQEVRDFLKQVDQQDKGADTKIAIDEFNKLVDDIANRRLDRTEVFRRMETLDAKLGSGAPSDKKALEQRLEHVGEELQKAELARPAGRALSNDDLLGARDSIKDLAKNIRAPGGPADKAKLDQLRDALKKAAEDAKKKAEEIARRREQLEDESLKLKSRLRDGGSDEERSLLEKKRRELERLDRETGEAKTANEGLDRLDRELEQAAEDLLKDMGQTADDLEQSAEELNRMQQQQMSQEEKQELRQKLQELRELVRQEGQGGKGQMLRLKRFGQMARGQGGGGPEQSGKGEGDGESSANGPSGSRGEDGQNGPGSDQKSQGGETWVVGPNGEKILMLSKTSSTSNGGGEGGKGAAPNNWGDGHDPAVQGKATNSKMGTEDTEVQGTDTGQGGSRSQAIQGAADRGFSSQKYRKVYTEYHQVAEESLAKDQIPDGYRTFVKRYFQLIRPRQEP